MGSLRLYISGPMTGYPAYNFAEFNAAEALLLEVGYHVENPAAKGIQDGWEWEDYLAYDLEALLKCQGVCALSGWEMSRGAQLEVYVAHQLRRPVLPLSLWLESAS